MSLKGLHHILIMLDTSVKRHDLHYPLSEVPDRNMEQLAKKLKGLGCDPGLLSRCRTPADVLFELLAAADLKKTAKAA